jgi:hypothetical protein
VEKKAVVIMKVEKKAVAAVAAMKVEKKVEKKAVAAKQTAKGSKSIQISAGPFPIVFFYC